jgi:hypothetical protein
VNALSHILAETEIDLPKIIFGLIFFIIWIVSAFVSWLNKKQQEAKQRAAQARDRLLGQTPAPHKPQRKRPARARLPEGIAQRFPEVLLAPMPAPAPMPQQRRPIPPLPKPARRALKAQQQGAIPVPRSLTLEKVALPAQSYVNITQPLTRPKPPTVDARAVRLFLTPATLRHQFILTEILHPPLALRPNPHDRV